VIGPHERLRRKLKLAILTDPPEKNYPILPHDDAGFAPHPTATEDTEGCVRFASIVTAPRDFGP